MGAGAAVVLRIILTFFVARLLEVPFLKLVGGALIIWLAIKIFVDSNPEKDPESAAKGIGQALKVILIADITMSLDNMLGVAAASKGNLFLLLFGLGTSIPIMIFTSNLLSALMDKYPIIIYVGAAVLGKVGGEMMMTDPLVTKFVSPGEASIIAAEVFSAVGVMVVGRLWVTSRQKKT
jgi:YjbE family integral membrane protein